MHHPHVAAEQPEQGAGGDLPGGGLADERLVAHRTRGSVGESQGQHAEPSRPPDLPDTCAPATDLADLALSNSKCHRRILLIVRSLAIDDRPRPDANVRSPVPGFGRCTAVPGPSATQPPS